ncbi:hypothetical protein L7F22_055859 [Adiantum nelumboides]|nr:hypothetical protein [Adiantum nelumboides]
MNVPLRSKRNLKLVKKPFKPSQKRKSMSSSSPVKAPQNSKRTNVPSLVLCVNVATKVAYTPNAGRLQERFSTNQVARHSKRRYTLPRGTHSGMLSQLPRRGHPSEKHGQPSLAAQLCSPPSSTNRSRPSQVWRARELGCGHLRCLRHLPKHGCPRAICKNHRMGSARAATGDV